MEQLRNLRLKTNCFSCVHKCCSQPHDWVYLTDREILNLKNKSGLDPDEFIGRQKNPVTGHVFKVLVLPCLFFNANTGQCTVYEVRPLVCRIFPFYPEPLTGTAALLPIQCGSNLEFLPENSHDGWNLAEFKDDARKWLADLWHEAVIKSTPTERS